MCVHRAGGYKRRGGRVASGRGKSQSGKEFWRGGHKNITSEMGRWERKDVCRVPSNDTGPRLFAPPVRRQSSRETYVSNRVGLRREGQETRALFGQQGPVRADERREGDDGQRCRPPLPLDLPAAADEAVEEEHR